MGTQVIHRSLQRKGERARKDSSKTAIHSHGRQGPRRVLRRVRILLEVQVVVERLEPEILKQARNVG